MTRPTIKIAAVNAQDWLTVPRAGKPGVPRHKLEALLKRIDAIDIRIANLRAGPSKSELELARIAHAAGCEVHCHSWVGVRNRAASGPFMGTSAATAKDGAIQGMQAAIACKQLGAKRFGANAERDVWRGPQIKVGKKLRRTANPAADSFLNALAVAFHAGQPKAALDYVGLAAGWWHYGKTDTDGDGHIDSAVRASTAGLYESTGVMAYQTAYDDVRTQLDRAAKEWPGHSRVPWLGVGRIDANNKLVGDADVSIRIAREEGAVCFYLGFGAVAQLFEGNARHRSIAAVIDELRPEACA
jgi:hypothetical protein